MTGEAPDSLIVERRDAPLIVSIPHADQNPRVRARASSIHGFAQGRRWRSTSFTISSRRSARHWCAQAFAPIIDVNPIQAERPLSWPGDDGTRPNHNLRRRSPRSAGLGAGMRPTLQSGDVYTSIPTTRRRRRDRAPPPKAAAGRVCSTPIPFARSSRACSRASCRCSISARIPARQRPGVGGTVGAVLAASGQSSIVDGRFEGGWITRAYGRPSQGVEALQLDSPAGPTSRSPTIRRQRTGQRRSTKIARRRHSRQSGACSRRFFRRSFVHEDDHTLSFPKGAKRAIGNPASHRQMAATLDPHGPSVRRG